jgi:hypothetical protein
MHHKLPELKGTDPQKIDFSGILATIPRHFLQLWHPKLVERADFGWNQNS